VCLRNNPIDIRSTHLAFLALLLISSNDVKICQHILIMFVAYVDYMFSIVGVVLCLRSCSYSAHPNDQGVGARYCVSMVLVHCSSTSAPYILVELINVAQ